MPATKRLFVEKQFVQLFDSCLLKALLRLPFPRSTKLTSTTKKFSGSKYSDFIYRLNGREELPLAKLLH
jgi:hypothetical protein